MRLVNNWKKLLVATVSATCVIVVILFSFIALIQLRQHDTVVAEQRGLTQKTATVFRSLIASDGLFKLPELGDKNTLESRIDATFMVSQIARNSYYVVATEKTKDSLYAYAQNKQNSLASRLKAYVALSNFKDKRWKEWQELAKIIDNSIPSEVSKNDVAGYLSVAEHLALLDENFKPRTKLIPFDPSTSEQSERLATSAIILNYLFTNGDELNKHFSNLLPKMCRWASGDATYTQQTLLAANALIGSDKSTCINFNYIKNLYGCKDSPNLLSINGNRSSTCSLVLTYYASRLGVTK